MKYLKIFSLLITISIVGFTNIVSACQYNIIPYPQQLITHSGQFSFNKNTVVLCSLQNKEELKLVREFVAQFQLVSGIKLKINDIKNSDLNNSVVFQTTDVKLESPEAYQLIISSQKICIKAKSGNGFFSGLQTLYQLLPVEIYGKKKASITGWSTPNVEITDFPRFTYRGLHLDVVRHFFPVGFIKKYIDAMAIHKFNTFHWHLTDDQGWRIEIKKYPRLTEIGSKRDETLIGHNNANFPQQFDGKPYGGFYTQKEAKEIVAYAKERFITVIPEIELPGHAQAAITAYPYLSCTRNPKIKVATKWGVFDEVFCPRDSTFKFLEDVLNEIMEIFPGKYIHIGGDECPKERWKACPDCQSLIGKLNLKDENELQSYFVERIEKFINSKGRQIIGWDEILDGGLAPNATVMSWRGITGGIYAAKAGHNVIMTPGIPCYFDKYQADPENEPLAIGGQISLQKVYEYEPIPTELSKTEANYILGAQANVWSEYLPTTESVEYMVFPRLSAMSEVLWGSKESRSWERFRQEMNTQYLRYNQLGIIASKAFFEPQFTAKLNTEKKLQISLSSDDPKAEIHYTTNGKIPTLQDKLYTEPIKLNESATVIAANFSNGKIIGKPLSKSFIVSKLTGMSYTKNLDNTGYTGGTEFALTDGMIGNAKFGAYWFGIGKSMDAEIVVDLNVTQNIERFSVGLQNAPSVCAIYPLEIKLYGSTTGFDYQLLAEKKIAPSTVTTWEMIRTELKFQTTAVRYLKMQLKSSGPCNLNPEKPSDSMILMDEIAAW